MAINIGTLEGVLRLKDELSKSLSNVANNIQQVNKYPRQLQASLVDLEKQMRKMAKTPSMRADAITSTKAIHLIQAQNRALAENIATFKKGPAAVKALNNERDVLNRLLAIGVTRESAYGKQLEQSIRTQQKYKQQLADLNKAHKSTAESIQDLGRNLAFYVGPQLIRTVTLPLVALGGSIIKFSTDFESSFAGVRKTVDATEEEFSQLSQSFRDLSKIIPVNVNELNKIGEAAGQLGIKKEAIIGFTRTVADLGATTNLSTQEASDGLARLANITQMPQEQFNNLGSAIVDLGNKFAGTEREILEMGLRIAGAGEIAGLTEGQILGIATALTSVGVEAEAGGTAVQKVLIRLTKAVVDGGRELEGFAATAGMTSKQFAETFRRDAGEAFNLFVQGLRARGQEAFKTLDELHLRDARLTRAFISLATAGDLLNNTMKVGVQAFKDNTALTIEAEKRYKTFQSQLTLTWNKIKDVAITLGQSLLPILRDVLIALEPLIKTLADLAGWFNELPRSVKITILVFGSLLAAIGPVVYITGQLLLAWGTIISVAPKMSAAITLATGPWGAIAAAITIATLAAVTWIDTWRKASETAINTNVNLANLQGRLLEFERGLKSTAGPTKQSTIQQARKDAEELAREIIKAQAHLDNLIKTSGQRRGAVKVAGGDVSRASSLIPADKEFAEAVQNVKSLTNSYDRAKKAISSVGQVITDVAGAATAAVKPLAMPGKELSKQAIETASDLENLRKELVKTAEANRQLAASYDIKNLDISGGVLGKSFDEQAESIERSRELFKQYLKDVDKFGQKAADSLKKLREENFDAAKSAKEAEKVFNSYLKAVSEGIKSIDIKFDIDKGRIAESLKSVSEDVIIKLSAITEVSFDSEKTIDEWDQFVNQITDGVKSQREHYKKYIADIKEAQERYKDSVEISIQLEQALYQARAQHIINAIDDFTSFANTLSNIFGGVFTKISGYLNTIQQLGQAGSQLGGIMTQYFGANSNWSSYLQTAGYVIGAYYAAFQIIDERAARRRARSFSQSITANATVTDWGRIYGGSSDEISRQLQQSLEAILSAIGGFVDELANIQIRVRNDGKEFQAIVNGIWIGTFKTSIEAISAAINEALRTAKFDHLGPLVVEALEQSIGRSLEEIESNLQFARRLETQNLPDDIANMVNTFVQFRTDFARALELFRFNLEASSQAILSVITNMVSTIWETYNRLTGRTEDPRVRAERERQAFNTNLALMKAQIIIMVAEIDARIDDLKATHAHASGIISHGRVIVGVTKVIASATSSLEELITQLEDARNALSEIVLPEPIEEGEIKPRRGAGRGQDRQNVLDFISDRRFQLSLAGLSDYQRQVAELNRQYADYAIQAGKNKELQAQLNQLKAKELALLEKEKIKSTVESFRDFLGLVSPFDQIRNTAKELIDNIKDSPLGDARKARMIGRVLDELDKKITQMSNEMAKSLLGNLITDLEKFGADESLLSEARKQMAIIEHVLKMEHYRTEIAILKAAGKLAPEVLATIEKAFNFLSTIDPTKFIGTGGAGSTGVVDTESQMWMRWREKQREAAKAAEKFADSIKEAKDLLQRYLDEGISPLQQTLNQINTDFDKITKALGNTPEIINAKNKAIERAMNEAFEGISDFYESILFGSDSFLGVQEQFDVAMSQFTGLANQISSGDFSKLEDLESLLPDLWDLATRMFGTSTGGFSEFRVMMLESLNNLLTGAGVSITDWLNGQLNTDGVIADVLPFTSSNIMPDTKEIVLSNNHIADVIDMTSVRQERLLQRANDLLVEIRDQVSYNSGGSSSTGFEYGNGS